MKEDIRNFNSVAKLFLALAAVRMGMSLLGLFSNIQINSMLGCSTEIYVVKSLFSVLAIIAIVFTYIRKRWALIALLVIAVTEFFTTIQYSSNISVAYQFGGNVAEFFINYGLFMIAMCFKKDGLSGWVSMLASEEYVQAHKTRIDESFAETVTTEEEEAE